MALTDEELLLQVNILASKTSDNPNMPYKTNAVLNKGLNPDYFSSNNSKIVNAINSLAADSVNTQANAKDVGLKLNSILLDIDATDNKPIWEHVQSLMGKPTIIEGLEDILTGKKQQEILGLNENDIGKFLTVDKNEDGQLIVKAMDAVLGGAPVSISAEEVAYSNEEYAEISNVKDALDFLFNNKSEGGITIPEEIFWDDIQNKPEIPNGLSINNDKLCLNNEYGEEVSSVDLVSDSDLDVIINELD